MTVLHTYWSIEIIKNENEYDLLASRERFFHGVIYIIIIISFTHVLTYIKKRCFGNVSYSESYANA